MKSQALAVLDSLAVGRFEVQSSSFSFTFMPPKEQLDLLFFIFYFLFAIFYFVNRDFWIDLQFTRSQIANSK